MKTLYKIKRHVLAPLSRQSQFVRFNGQLGWLTLSEEKHPDPEIVHRQILGHRVLSIQGGDLGELETATEADLAVFVTKATKMKIYSQ